MKVKELIAELQKRDPEADITVPVQAYTQRYPSGYFQISEVSGSPWKNREGANGVRIWVHLPKGFIISERKKS
jgi:ADP-heptose:LPS heptosyltransferase